MRSIAIVDDSPTQRDRLAALTRHICMETLGFEPAIQCFATTEELEQAITTSGNRNFPSRFCSIALMDIEIDGGRNGIEAVHTLFPEGSGVQVVYITGFIEYCTAVYETEHVSFLLKPVKTGELEHALRQAIANAMHSGEPLHITVNKRDTTIYPERILYIESRLRMLNLHCTSNVIRTYMRLNSIEPQLPDYFLRCHTSFLVNMHAVEMSTGTDLILTNGEKVPISQRRRKLVHDAIVARSRIAPHART